MSRIIAIGNQDFEKIRSNGYFYIDKTAFLKEWWENGDDVTLITRPRRFGKTLTMSMTQQFFSNKYKNRTELFQDLHIWKEEKYKELQGTYPVIFLSFANVKETSFVATRKKINQILVNLFSEYDFLLQEQCMTDNDLAYFRSITLDMDETVSSMALHQLSRFLYQYYGKKVIILLDEYDTPMQEAYVNEYWIELSAFTRNLFNATFKTNPCLERAIMTGITRVSKESVFSDLNNLEVVTTTSQKYADTFGFTEEEVEKALEEYHLSDKMQDVKKWYDGFTFGKRTDLYNPWSIINFLDKKILTTYWANTSSNGLVGRLIQEASADIKVEMETLMQGGSIASRLDEQIIFSQLQGNQEAIWSFLLASGYLKTIQVTFDEERGDFFYELALTNREVRLMFQRIIREWFADGSSCYNDFIKALLLGDVKAMNQYMNRVTMTTFSFFDTGRRPTSEPERFYHGFVLGLLVELENRYVVTSNRESGFGRYDVMLEPKSETDRAMILEFKVFDPEEEKDLTETVERALEQIEDRQYIVSLTVRGIGEDRICKYGFAFEGKKVLIGTKAD